MKYQYENSISIVNTVLYLFKNSICKNTVFESLVNYAFKYCAFQLLIVIHYKIELESFVQLNLLDLLTSY